MSDIKAWRPLRSPAIILVIDQSLSPTCIVDGFRVSSGYDVSFMEMPDSFSFPPFADYAYAPCVDAL